MQESSFQYHVLAFQELKTVPPQELETVPPLEGPFSHYKNRVFEDFCDILVPIRVFLFSGFSTISDLFLLIHRVSQDFVASFENTFFQEHLLDCVSKNIIK